MDVVARLRRDHLALRAKLDVIESAVEMGPETWYVVRELCCRLLQQLGDHIKREERLIAAARNKRTQPSILQEIAFDHSDEPRLLAGIVQVFHLHGEHALPRVRPGLIRLIHGLRRHMDMEETELFPQLASTPAPQTVGMATGRGVSSLDETMTVNRVIRFHRRAQGVFERLLVDPEFEGDVSLDEVAWRHGMTARELIDEIEDALC